MSDFEEFLPPREHRPSLIYPSPMLYYPQRVNLARETVDRQVEAGNGGNVAYFCRSANGVARTITYRELQRNANRMGNVLKGLGVGIGDRVLLSFREIPELVYTALGAVKIGAIIAGFSPLSRAREIAYFAGDTKAKVLVVQGPPTYLTEEIDRAGSELSGVQKIAFAESDIPGFLSYQKLMAAASEELEAAPTTRDDFAVLTYTGGTTGFPKGCMHTHRSVLASADLRLEHSLRFRRGDVLYGTGPTVNAFGFGDKVACTLRGGASSVLLEDTAPESLLKAIADFKITHFVGVAVQFRFVTEEQVRKYDTSSLRSLELLNGHEHDYRHIKALFGLDALNPFGMSCLFHIITAPQGAPTMSLGKLLPGYEGYVAPVDKDEIFDEAGNVNEVEPGTVGRLILRGPTGFIYWNKSARAAEDVVDGWSLLDDGFTRDENGYLFWRTRLDDVIKTSGYNVAPIEVETVLHEHAAVQRAAVVGVPDAEGSKGMLIKAFIRLKQGYEPSLGLQSEIKDFVKDRIAPYKYPRLIEFTDDLAEDHLSKIRYKELRARG